MKTLPQLDFLAGAPRPWGGIALAGLAAVLLAGVAFSSWRIEQDNRRALARLNEQAARLLPPAPRKLSETERVRLTQARVAGELRPWGDLLATFEEHGQGDIGLLKLEPDAKAGVVRITGQARDAKSLLPTFELRPMRAGARSRSPRSSSSATPGAAAAASSRPAGGATCRRRPKEVS